MKRLAIIFLLFPGVALAQQVDPVTAGANAMALDGSASFGRMAAQITQDRQQVAALQKQVADLTVERDKLKADAAKPAPAVEPSAEAKKPQ